MKDKLQIILITYNRRESLKQTLDQLFALNSPVKDFDITILDNKSTDGTTELIEQYVLGHSNLKHIIHKRNIGGNANIARAFEVADKKYVWVLGDDDKYDFTYWNDVEAALEQNYDAVVVSRNNKQPERSLGALMNELSFLAGGIYKTSNIDDDVMFNMQFNIFCWFPHLAIACRLVNDNKSIKILDNAIVKRLSDNDALQKMYPNRNPVANGLNWQVAFAHAMTAINDKNKRNSIFKDCFWNAGQNLFDFEMLYPELKRSGSLWNYFTLFAILPARISLMIKFILAKITGIYFYRSGEYMCINLWEILKTKIYKVGVNR